MKKVYTICQSFKNYFIKWHSSLADYTPACVKRHGYAMTITHVTEASGKYLLAI